MMFCELNEFIQCASMSSLQKSVRVCVCEVNGPSAASCSSTSGLWSTAGGSDLALKEIVMGMSQTYYYTASSSPCLCSFTAEVHMLFLISATV